MILYGLPNGITPGLNPIPGGTEELVPVERATFGFKQCLPESHFCMIRNKNKN